MPAQTITELLVSIGVEVKDAEKAEKRVKEAKKAVDDAGDAADKARKKTSLWGKITGQVAAGIRRDVKDKAESAWKDLHKTIAKGAAAIGAALTAVVVGTFAFVNSQTAALDATNKLSASLGLGVEELQRLEFAASQSGVASDALRMGMLFLNKQMLDVAQGGGKAFEDALASIGLSFDQLQGRSRTEQLGMIGDALNMVEDDATRAALAGKLLGEESGPRMATMLREGTEGLNKLSASAKGVFTQEDADRATAFQDRMGEIKNELGAVSNVILSALLPDVEDAAAGFKAWVAQNDEFIKQDLPKFLAAIGKGLATIAEFVANLVKAVSWLIEKWNELVAALGPVGVVLDAVADALFVMIAPVVALVEAVNKLASAWWDASEAASSYTSTAEGIVAKGKAEAMREFDRVQKLRQRQEQRASAPPQVARGADLRNLFRAQNASNARAAMADAGKGGGASAAAKEKELPPGVTVDEVLRQMQAGNMEVLRERLAGIQPSAPSVSKVQPTVAITMNHVEVEQNITTSDPVVAGRESASHLRDLLRAENRRAAAFVGSNVVE